MPKLSIITVNYNNLNGLKKTIDSVINQSFTDYEYIIIDGGSIDGGKEYIEEKAEKFVCWISEKDNGVYDAMNKGINQAKGEYLLFLNSGDYLLNNNVLLNVFTNHPFIDIIYYDLFWDIDGEKVYQPYPDILSFEHFITNGLPHQASFIKRDVFHKVGMYDTNYKIIADWKFFMLAILKHNHSYKHIELPISVCDRKGISCNPSNWETIVRDRNQIINENFPVFLNDYKSLIDSRSELKDLQKKVAIMKMNIGYRLHQKIKKIIKRDRKK